MLQPAALPDISCSTFQYCNITPGKTLNGSKAKKLGLVDSVADPYALEHAAVLVRQGHVFCIMQ